MVVMLSGGAEFLQHGIFLLELGGYTPVVHWNGRKYVCPISSDVNELILVFYLLRHRRSTIPNCYAINVPQMEQELYPPLQGDRTLDQYERRGGFVPETARARIGTD